MSDQIAPKRRQRKRHPASEIVKQYRVDRDAGKVYTTAGHEVLKAIGPNHRAQGNLSVRNLKRFYFRDEVIWAAEYGAWPEFVLVHLDGDYANDSIHNLAPAPPEFKAIRRKMHGKGARREFLDRPPKKSAAEMSRDANRESPWGRCPRCLSDPAARSAGPLRIKGSEKQPTSAITYVKCRCDERSTGNL